jgi:P-type Cu+ transporter
MRDLPMANSGQEVLDPVCGMTVDPEQAESKGLSAEHDGTTYYFCGRGCMLDFQEDPERYLAPDYRPSM